MSCSNLRNSLSLRSGDGDGDGDGDSDGDGVGVVKVREHSQARHMQVVLSSTPLIQSERTQFPLPKKQTRAWHSLN